MLSNLKRLLAHYESKGMERQAAEMRLHISRKEPRQPEPEPVKEVKSNGKKSKR